MEDGPLTSPHNPRGPTAATQSAIAFVAPRLRALCRAAGFNSQDTERSMHLLAALCAPWGDRSIGIGPSFPSDIGDDHFPIELSLALGGGTPEVRVLFEAQPQLGGDVAAQWCAGLALTRAIAAQHAGVCIDRLDAIASLFAPTDAAARYGLWHAVCLRAGQPPRFKIYVNPQAQGKARAHDVVTEALRRLGFAHLGERVARVRRPGDELKFFSLDLDDDPDARVKVYKVHASATRADIDAELSLSRAHRPDALREFWRAIVGSEEPLRGLPVSTYLSLTSNNDEPTSSTAHVPVRAYAPDDAEVRERLRGYLPAPQRDVYERAIEGFAQRSLADGAGMHSYVSLALDARGARTTVYLCPEAYR